MVDAKVRRLSGCSLVAHWVDNASTEHLLASPMSRTGVLMLIKDMAVIRGVTAAVVVLGATWRPRRPSSPCGRSSR